MKSTLLQLLTYDHWASERLISTMTANPPVGTTQKLMSHIIAAQYVWYARIQQQPSSYAAWHLFTQEELSQRAKDAYTLWVAMIDTLEEIALREIFSYTNTKGQRFINTIEDTALHLCHHAAYHRGQIAAQLSAKSIVPPVTDYIAFVR
ncbi:MAG: DinB family protein [Bacteroidota bacterium]